MKVTRSQKFFVGLILISVIYRGGALWRGYDRVNTGLGLANPARGRAATAPEYSRTRFWAKRYII